ncbi:MAG TPA: hypothetical protein VF678_05630, partial [bacterium]
MEAQFAKPYETDPRTAAATLARWQHGLNSKHLLGPDEDQGELEMLHQRLMRGMAPENEFEEEIAGNTVGTQWLIRRLHRQVCGNLELHFNALGRPKISTPNVKQGGAMMKDYASIRMQHHLVGQIIRLGNQTLANGRALALSQAQRRKGFGNGEPGSARGSGGGARVKKSTGVSKDGGSGEIVDRGLTLPGRIAGASRERSALSPSLSMATAAMERGAPVASQQGREPEVTAAEVVAVTSEMSTGIPNDSGSGEISDRAALENTAAAAVEGEYTSVVAPEEAPLELRSSGAILAHALGDPEAVALAEAPPEGLTDHDRKRWERAKAFPEAPDEFAARVRSQLKYYESREPHQQAPHADEIAVLRR